MTKSGNTHKSALDSGGSFLGDVEANVSQVQDHAILRVPGTVRGQNFGSGFGKLVWLAAVAHLYDGDIEEQTRLTLAELDRLLERSGTERRNLLSVTIYLADLKDKPRFDEIWLDWVGAQEEHWPQRACLEVGLGGDVKVELVAVAARS